MNSKDIKDLKKFFTDRYLTILTVYGAYVDERGQIDSTFSQDLMDNLPEELRKRILGIFKNNLSGKPGTNVIPVDIEYEDDKRSLMESAIRTNLKDENIRNEIFTRIKDSSGINDTAYLILGAVNSVDIISRSSDGQELDSDSQFAFVMFTICPVKRPEKNSLYYSSASGGIYEQFGELFLGNPMYGIMYPAFEEGGANVSRAAYYTKDTKVINQELIDALFTQIIPTAAPEEQRLDFNTAVAEALGDDCSAETVLMIHDSIREWSKESEDAQLDVADVSSDDVALILRDTGMEEEGLERFRTAMNQSAGETVKLTPRNLVPQKDTYETAHVKITISPEYRDMVKADVINGRKCLIVYADEGVTVNGINVLFNNDEKEDLE